MQPKVAAADPPPCGPPNARGNHGRDTAGQTGDVGRGVGRGGDRPRTTAIRARARRGHRSTGTGRTADAADVVIVGGGAIGQRRSRSSSRAIRRSAAGSRRRARPDLPAGVVGAVGQLDPPAVLDAREHPDVALRLVVPGRGGPPPRGRRQARVESACTRPATCTWPARTASRPSRANHAVQRAEGADVVAARPAELAGALPVAVDRRPRARLARARRRGLVRRLCACSRRSAARRARSASSTSPDEVVALRAVGQAHRGGGPRRRDPSSPAARSSTPPVRGRPASPRWPASALPVEARRRCVFVFDARRRLPALPARHRPLGRLVPAGGRRSSSAGRTRRRPRTPRTSPLEVDRRQFEEVLWPALAARVPAFEAIKVDQRLGRLLRIRHVRPQRDPRAAPGDREPRTSPTASAATASSSRRPSGRAIAELIAHGRYVSLDLSIFGYERIAAGRRVDRAERHRLTRRERLRPAIAVRRWNAVGPRLAS